MLVTFFFYLNFSIVLTFCIRSKCLGLSIQHISIVYGLEMMFFLMLKKNRKYLNINTDAHAQGTKV